MPKIQKDNLFDLIKSLSKSEKRQFSLYAGRLGVNEQAKFMQLFAILDKQSQYNEAQILTHKEISKKQLSNLKGHLYKQILISLRLNPIHQNIRLQIREQLDFATILYHKGLFSQSLKMLERAKAIALEHEEKNMAAEIIELEKVIESQYITRSISNRAELLVTESALIGSLNEISSQLSNLSLQLYSLFLQKGYVKTDAELKYVNEFFQSRMPALQRDLLGFRERLWYYNAQLWYNFIIQDFLACYTYATRWTELFYRAPKMIDLNPVFYLRGAQYLLESLFFIGDVSRFKTALSRFEQTLDQPTFPQRDNVQSLAFLYRYGHKFNAHFMAGTFDEGLSLVEPVLQGIQHYREKIDEHHIMIFYYKIACLYFGCAQYKKCIYYLSLIIENKSLGMREDLLCFSRILNLVAHYEAGIDYQIERLIRSTYKFLIKMEDLHEVQRAMISFIRSLTQVYPHEIKNSFKGLHKTLSQYKDDPFERRSFLYLDILTWLQSNIEGKSIPEIIQQRVAQASSK
jgi:hypothetical protein